MVAQDGPDTRGLTRELVKAYESANLHDAGLVYALDLAEESLRRLPESFSFAYRDSEGLPADADGEKLMFIVFHNLWCWLGFLLHSTSYRARWLINDVWGGLDEREFLRTCFAARGLLELSAVLNDAHRKLVPVLSFLSGWPSGELTPALTARLVEAHLICIEHAKVTRFNWEAGLKGDIETLVSSPDAERPATNVLTLLERLPQEPAGIVAWHYKLLCDFVHPNMASQLLPSEGGSWLDEETVTLELRYRPRSVQALEYVLNAVAFPVRVALTSLTEQLADFSASHSVAYDLKELFAPTA